MANEKNLKMFTSEQSREEAAKNGKKGGIASGVAKREKKTIQRILDDYLSQDIKSNKNLRKLAETVGINGDQSIKELMTAVCILNTIKKGDVDKLIKVCELLGEDNNIQVLEDISDAEADIFGED